MDVILSFPMVKKTHEQNRAIVVKRRKVTAAANRPIENHPFQPGKSRLWAHFRGNLSPEDVDVTLRLFPEIKDRVYINFMKKHLHQYKKRIVDNDVVMQKTKDIVHDQMKYENMIIEELRMSFIFRIEHRIPLCRRPSAPLVYIEKLYKRYIVLDNKDVIKDYRETLRKQVSHIKSEGRESFLFDGQFFILKPQYASAILSTPLIADCHAIIWQYLESTYPASSCF